MRREVYLHIIFWAIITLTFTISQWNYNNTLLSAFVFELLFLPTRLIGVYVNWFYLVPKILYKEKYIEYFVVIVLLILVLAIAQRAFNLLLGYPAFFPNWIDDGHIHILKFTRIMQNALIIASPVAFTTGWRLFADWKEKREKNFRLEKEKREAQLEYLKSQINPHFLFNTLNNIYGHALEESKKVPELLLKLSDFLSFSLYESNAQIIPLEKELSLVNNVVDLEKSRFEDRVSVKFDIMGSIEDISVPPLILLPFVENAFKHGLKDETDKAFIDIQLKASDEQLYFKVENSKVSGFSDHTQKSGLGLKNIRERLDLLYGKQYSLDISKNKEIFIIELLINLR